MYSFPALRVRPSCWWCLSLPVASGRFPQALLLLAVSSWVVPLCSLACCQWWCPSLLLGGLVVGPFLLAEVPVPVTVPELSFLLLVMRLPPVQKLLAPLTASPLVCQVAPLTSRGWRLHFLSSFCTAPFCQTACPTHTGTQVFIQTPTGRPSSSL